MKHILVILMIITLPALSGCGRKRYEGVYDPLVMKYLAYPSGIVVERVYDKDGFVESYAVPGLWGGVPGWEGETIAKTKLSWVGDGKVCTPEVSCRTYPELTEILRKSGTVVSNAYAARDIRDLFEIVMKAPNNITRHYLVESVDRTGNVWVVEAKYWGNIDDKHRRPSKVVHRILVSESNRLQDVIEEIHPRPMDMK